MRSRPILTLLAAGAMSLGVVTIASAGSTTSDDIAPVATFGPANHGGLHNDGGKPDGAGDESGDRGKPDVTGRPANAGLHTLPEQASDQAKAVVAAAFEHHQAIRLQLADIRDLSPGERGQAVSTLMSDFGELFRLAGDAADGDGDGDEGDE